MSERVKNLVPCFLIALAPRKPTVARNEASKNTEVGLDRRQHERLAQLGWTRYLGWPPMGKSRLTPRGTMEQLHRPVNSGCGRSRRSRKSAQMMIDVAVQRVDHRQALEIVADIELVGHAHAAMDLDRALADETARFADLRLRGGRGLGALRVARQLQRHHQG